METIEITKIFALIAFGGFILSFPIPFFARRFDKFLPADPGTALVLSFHIPKFAKSLNTQRQEQRAKLWRQLLFAGVKWGSMGAFIAVSLVYRQIYIAFFAMIWICALLACIDEKIHILPDVLTFPLIVLGFFCASCNVLGISALDSASGALAGFLLPTITSAVMTPFRPRSLGGGDFKMLVGVGAWLGFMGLSVAIFLSFVFFGLIAVFKHQKEGPYGTSLLLAVLGTLILKNLEYFKTLFVFV